MQKADDDNHQIAELKLHIDRLQRAIEKISRHIYDRQRTPDVNQDDHTQIVNDMKDIQSASVRLKKRATMQFEHLTSLSEDHKAREPRIELEKILVNAQRSTAEQPISSLVPGIDATSYPYSQPLLTLPSNSSSIRSSEAARITTSTRYSSLLQKQQRWSGSARSAMLTEAPSFQNSPSLTLTRGKSFSSGAPHMRTSSVSPQEFEEQVSSLLSISSAQGMGINKPFSEELVIRVADLLSAVGKGPWSERPRMYLVLRLLKEVKLMDDFVLDDFKDIDFPCTETTLPPCIKESGVQHDFLHVQKYVLSERSVDLVRGGRHRHLGKFRAKCHWCGS
ncbi:hypothetical protein DE146DRAFT_12028 [Phaeosphaeria sp. MPI-PUGE-AT-0046c]|nr:hypothetical protein DE146DRAFT_12028 [Phaeosphaeria sp. MPI-PUGE-AT-0046c]